MKQETEVKAYLVAGSLIIGAVITMTIGFAWGGWSTSSTTKVMAEEAVLASKASICVAQFMKEPNHEEKLREFEKETSWQRDDFIKEGGWDKMPGQEQSDASVNQACVEELELLMGK